MIRNADKFKIFYSGFINRVHAICTGSHFKDVRRNILFISDLYHCCAFLPFLHCDCRCTHISPRERLLVHSPVQTRHGRMQCPFPLLNGLYRWVFCPVIRAQQQMGRSICLSVYASHVQKSIIHRFLPYKNCLSWVTANDTAKIILPQALTYLLCFLPGCAILDILHNKGASLWPT